MRHKALVFGAIALLSGMAGVYFGIQRTSEPAQTGAVARLFSETMPTVAGQPQALAEWKGKTLVVNFWATWCAPCVEEMPELSALQTEIGTQNMQIIGIGIDTAENMRAFAARYDIQYPLYIGGVKATELTRQFGNQAGGLPFTVLISPEGKVQKTYLGRLHMETLRDDLRLPKVMQDGHSGKALML